MTEEHQKAFIDNFTINGVIDTKVRLESIIDWIDSVCDKERKQERLNIRKLINDFLAY